MEKRSRKTTAKTTLEVSCVVGGRSPREHTQALASIQKKRTEDKKKDSVGGGVEGGGSGVQTHQNLMKARVDSSRGRNSGKNVYAVLR